jgi:hypothetical protein
MGSVILKPDGPATLEPEAIDYYFPLFGLQRAEESLLIGDVVLYLPDLETWWDVEKSDVVATHVLEGGRPIPWCLLLGRFIDGERREATFRHWPEVQAEASDVVLALRLYKDGTFIDPWYVGAYSRAGIFNERLPGPYRQGFYDLDVEDPYVLSDEDREPVEALAALIGEYRRARSHTAGDIAVENFRHSFGPYVQPQARLAMLFAALESLLGGLGDQDRVGNVPPAARAAVAVSETGEPDRSVQRLLAGRGRRWRNAVAHGSLRRSEDIDEMQRTLSAIVRATLQGLLWFSVYVGEMSEDVRRRCGLDRDAPPAVGYNQLLAAAYGGNETARDMVAGLDPGAA